MAAKSRRMAPLHHLIFPQPFDTLSQEQIQQIARLGYDDAIAALTVPGRGVVEVQAGGILTP